MKNVFKSPEQYALLLIDIADESPTNKWGIANDLLMDAKAQYNLPQSYVDAVLGHLDHWVICGIKPE